MSDYTPDRWVVLELTTPEQSIYKVFAGWHGGYMGSDSWKLNSGIVSAHKAGYLWEFEGYSGSVYHCHESNYGMTMYQQSILAGWQQNTESGLRTQIRVLDYAEVETVQEKALWLDTLKNS